MHPDELFCKTIDDIQSVVENPTSYEILRSTALLRQLLLDGNRLVDVVNRQRRLRLRFTIADGWEHPVARMMRSMNPAFLAILDNFQPDAQFPNTNVRDLTRDQLLSYDVMLINGRNYTVANIISHCANVVGGVHIGEPRTPEEHELTSIQETIEVGGFSVNLRQLLPVLRVVLDGLRPLYDAIRTTDPTGGI